jgi:uncharacterized tellurite resistance protein B-like protein
VPSILKKLGFVRVEPPPENRALLQAIENRLSALGAGRAELVAVFAALLARVAYADQEISDKEASTVSAVLREHAALAPDEADAVVLVAQHQTIAIGGAENHVLTRRFNEVSSEDDRRRLVDCLYAVATADDLVTHVEDREIRNIASALMVPSSVVLEIRSRYRDKLEELQLLRKVRGG